MTQITQQSNFKSHKLEGILEGESFHLDVLVVGGRHDNIVGGVPLPHQDECDCLVGIVFLHFEHDQK